MVSKQRGLQSNPLDTVIPDLREGNGVISESTEGAVSTKRIPSQRSKRKRFTAHVDSDLVERAKNAVFWTPGLTMAHLIERALTTELESLEKQNGGAFEERASENPGGRPLS